MDYPTCGVLLYLGQNIYLLRSLSLKPSEEILIHLGANITGLDDGVGANCPGVVGQGGALGLDLVLGGDDLIRDKFLMLQDLKGIGRRRGGRGGRERADVDFLCRLGGTRRVVLFQQGLRVGIIRGGRWNDVLVVALDNYPWKLGGIWCW